MYATREDLRAAAGEIITCGIAGIDVTSETREILREVQPGGLILFARNIDNPAQCAALTRELKLLRKDSPLSLSVDQEGGRVARVRAPATEWPPMRTLGDIGDPDLVQRVGLALARELRAMNFDIDYAPVLDVDSNPDNPIIGDRSFSRDPAQVSLLGTALVQGLHAGGVAACGKHFPGHGDTDVDSHLALPYIGHELPRLREIEWPPFQAAIEAGLGAIMTAHVVIESLESTLPATLSKTVLDHLRNELGFQGVIISDDLEMKAVAERYTAKEMAQLGLSAGVDHFLVCEKPDVIFEFYRALVRCIEEKTISHQTVMDAAKRSRTWRERYYQPPGDEKDVLKWVGCGEHSALRHEIDARAAMLRGETL